MACPFEKMFCRRFLVLGGGGVGLFLLITFLAMPYYTLWQIKNAVDSGQAEKLAAQVDFPELRKNIKIQLKGKAGQALHRYTGNAGMASWVEAFLGSSVADQMVDFLVTPEGLIRLLRQRSDLDVSWQESFFAPSVKTDSGASEGGGDVLSERLDLGQAWQGQDSGKNHFSWKSLSEFAFSHSQGEKKSITIVLQRRGWLSWKLTNLLLPVE
jgi:hypothetical protein